MAVQREERVEHLPRRVAHVVHALLVTVKELNMPVRAGEVVIYDEEARDARATGRALARARQLGLAVRTPGNYWVPTFLAMDMRSELEDRYLRETEELLDE